MQQFMKKYLYDEISKLHFPHQEDFSRINPHVWHRGVTNRKFDLLNLYFNDQVINIEKKRSKANYPA